MICYYRFGFVSIIIADEYYFFDRIDIFPGPLPKDTILGGTYDGGSGSSYPRMSGFMGYDQGYVIDDLSEMLKCFKIAREIKRDLP